ncbi:MAG: hypothetical protein ABFR95_02055 [Actinomycetota bacterium]
MVSRAVLTDDWRGVVVETQKGPWLAATSDALAPDPDGLIARGVDKGGPPREYAAIKLVKVTIRWGGKGMAQVVNPVVLRHPEGAPVAVLPLSGVSALDSQTESGVTAIPLSSNDVDSHGVPDEGDEFDVLTLLRAEDGSYWPVVRRAFRASPSDIDFLGHRGAIALDVDLCASDAGLPVVSRTRGVSGFDGLVQPVSSGVAVLLPRDLIAETIASAAT